MSTMQGDASRFTNIWNTKEMFGYEKRDQLGTAVDAYDELFKNESKESINARKEQYGSLVVNFYNLVTTFYEYGWGQSFHFAPRHAGESFESSIVRLEYFVALRLALGEGIRCIDLGCGVGGPARNVARFSKAHITGVNCNSYQIGRAKLLTEQQHLSSLCSFVEGDFMKLSFENNTFDAGYQLEALCHAPDKARVYAEAFRVLKPGARFAGLQWLMTPKYDPNNKRHVDLKFGIERGNGIPDLGTFEAELDAIKAAGFKVIQAYDKALEDEIPWYDALAADYSIQGWRHTPMGRTFTHYMVWALEKCWVAPKGSTKAHELLLATAVALVEAGRLGIFTPSFFYLIEKPADAAAPAAAAAAADNE